MRCWLIVFICLFSAKTLAQNEQEQVLVYNAFYQYYIDGEYLKARKSLEPLVLISSDSLLISKRDVYHSMGILSGRLAQYDQALYYLSLSEDFCDPPSISPYPLLLNYNSRANIYQFLGDFQKSALFFEKALDMILASKDHSGNYYDYLSMIYLNYGILSYKQEDYDLAKSFLLSSLNLKLENNLDYIFSVYMNLAKVADRKKEYAEAEKYYKLSETSFIESYGEFYYLLGDLYLEYAELLIEIHNYKQAEQYILKGIDLSIKNVGLHHPGTASAWQILGDLYAAQNDYGKALDSYQKALTAIHPDFSAMELEFNPPAKGSLDDIRYIEILEKKGKAWFEQGQEPGGREEVGVKESREKRVEGLGNAIECVQLAIEVKNNVQNSYASIESRMYLSENEKNLYVEGIRYAMRLYELEKSEEHEELAYYFASLYKANELRKTIHSREAIRQIEKQDPLYSELNMFNQSMRQYSNFIIQEEQNPVPDSIKISAWKNELFSFNRSFDSLETQAKTKSWYAKLHSNPTLFSSKEIQRKLNSNQSLIDYVISSQEDDGSRELFIFVIGKDGLSISEQNLSQEFWNSLSYYLESLSSQPEYTSSLAAYDSLKTASYHLYSKLFQPIESLLKAKDLIIVPDAELLLLPFESLISSNAKEEIINFSGLPYLVHNYCISYALSGSLAFSNREISYRKPQVVAFAPGIGKLSGSDNETLEKARDEIDVAAQLFPGSFYYDSDATKAKFLQYNTGNDILHFAMHSNRGSFIELEGSLEFYPDGSDNKLWGYEISFLDIESPLVVLSGCNTGLGKINSAEGVFSLSRNFMEAGAESIIQTLWSVDDGASSSIIQEFYKNIAKGRKKNISLHRAKKDYLAGVSPFFAHPYYWSGIQLLGNTDAIVKSKSNRALATALLLIALVLAYFVRRWILRKRVSASD